MKPAPPPGRARRLRFAEDMPVLLPLLQQELASPEHDPLQDQALRRLQHLLRKAPPGPTDEAQVRQGLIPFFGWVWEVEGRPIALVAATPLSRWPRRYLLANIVVHPAHRGRGIGRHLVEQALTYIRQRHGQAWLEVERDNHRAQRFYARLGFRYADERTSWTFALDVRPWRKASTPVRVRSLQRRDWSLLQPWLEQAYPRRYQWRWPPQPLRWVLQPGLRGALARVVQFATDLRRWVLVSDRGIEALWAWEPETGLLQPTLYLVGRPDLPAAVLKAALRRMAQELEPVLTFTPAAAEAWETQPYHLYLELPAERHTAALRALGWRVTRQWWWMWTR